MKKALFVFIFLLSSAFSYGQMVEGWSFEVVGTGASKTTVKTEIVQNGIQGCAMKVTLHMKSWASAGVPEYVILKKTYPTITITPDAPYVGMWRKVLSVSDNSWCRFFCFVEFRKLPDTPGDTILTGMREWGYSKKISETEYEERLTFETRRDWYSIYGPAKFNQMAIEFAIMSDQEYVDIEFLLDDLNYCGSIWPSGETDSVGKIYTTSPYTKYNIIFERFGDSPQPLTVEKLSNEIPQSITLSQNYPNPFNPSTKIRFSLTKVEQVSLVIYDALGREVETLINQTLNAGVYEKEFNPKGLSSGIYFYKLKTNSQTVTKKMIFSK